uniref:Ribosomal protein L19 n=1 Tax=Oryza rufipogon TaxID=4529 RepID=A0A0E0NFP3_ORYRU
MQSLLRRVHLAGSHGSAAKLLSSAASEIAQSGAKNELEPTVGYTIKLALKRPDKTAMHARASIIESCNCKSRLTIYELELVVGYTIKLALRWLNAEVDERGEERDEKQAILNMEAADKVLGEREIPDVQPGCILQMRLQVPENKRRESTLKGIVIARRNAGINTTFRLRRLVAGVGVDYSPNIKEIKVLDRKKVRRAKLYYLRDRMNALKK